MGALVSPRPLIGVSTSEVRVPESFDPIPDGEPPRRELALGLTYLKAVEDAGGIPVILPPLAPEGVEPLLDNLAAVCLSGGPDIDPATYGAERSEKVGPTEPELDHFELALTRHADARSMPILAICRGAQIVNVARGGDLFQDIPDEVGREVLHRIESPGACASHPISVDPRSRLGRIIGPKSRVNSYHHQAVRRLGRGLRPVAWAPDGLVEAFEAPTGRFMVGVQWHAEGLVPRPDQAELFSRFVAAGRRYAQSGRRLSVAA